MIVNRWCVAFVATERLYTYLKYIANKERIKSSTWIRMIRRRMSGKKKRSVEMMREIIILFECVPFKIYCLPRSIDRPFVDFSFVFSSHDFYSKSAPWSKYSVSVKTVCEAREKNKDKTICFQLKTRSIYQTNLLYALFYVWFVHVRPPSLSTLISTSLFLFFTIPFHNLQHTFK